MPNYKNSSNMHNYNTLQIPIYSDTYVIMSKNIPSKRTKGWEVEKSTCLAKDAVSINWIGKKAVEKTREYISMFHRQYREYSSESIESWLFNLLEMVLVHQNCSYQTRQRVAQEYSVVLDPKLPHVQHGWEFWLDHD